MGPTIIERDMGHTVSSYSFLWKSEFSKKGIEMQECTCLASVHCVFLSFVTRGQDGRVLPAVMAIDGW